MRKMLCAGCQLYSEWVLEIRVPMDVELLDSQEDI
jgi:hypothetical protein